MSDNWDDDDFDYDSDDNSGGGLRKQLEQALKKLKQAEKRAADAERRESQREIAETLKQQGYTDQRVVRWMAKDDVDFADSDAVSRWLKENEDLVGEPKAASTDDDERHDDAQDVESEPDDPDMVDAYSRVQQIHTQASPATRSRYEQATRELSDDATPEQVRAAFMGSGV